MRNEGRILLNTAALSSAEGLGQLANLLLMMSFARHFGAAAMGYYSVGMSIGAVASVLVSLGIEGLLVRDISQNPACGPERLGVLFPMQLLLMPAAWLLSCVASMAVIRHGAALLIVIAASGYQVLLPLGALLLTPLRAREQMRIAAACGLVPRLLILILGGSALHLGASAGVVALSFLFGGVLFIVMAWRQSTRHCGPLHLHWAPRQACALYRRGMPFFGLTALSVLYTRGTTILLGALSAGPQVGLYAVADRLMIPLALGPAMFNAAVYPALARVTQNSLSAAQELCGRCVRLLLVVTVPLAAFGSLFAANIIGLFFGPHYLDAAPVLQVLAWTLPVRGVQYVLGSQLAALHHQGSVVRARFAGLSAFAVLSPLLILTHGFVGAAWALLLCDSAQLLLYSAALLRLQAAPALSVPLLAPLAAAALTGLASPLLTETQLVYRLPAMVLIMAVGLWGFGAIRSHDLHFLRAVLARR